MAIFRIVKAEFIKVLKKPMIYIMALLLVGTILGSYYLYEPDGYSDETVSYNNTANVTMYYDSFYSDVADSKSTFDAEINKANIKYNYYLYQNTRRTKLTQYFNDIKQKYDALVTAVTSSDGDYQTARKTAFFELKEALNTYVGYYDDFSLFTSYPFINTLITSDEYKSGKQLIQSSILATYFDPVNSTNFKDSDATNVYQGFTASKYIDEMDKINNNAINFIK